VTELENTCAYLDAEAWILLKYTVQNVVWIQLADIRVQ
jgi:hypothetical protein